MPAAAEEVQLPADLGALSMPSTPPRPRGRPPVHADPAVARTARQARYIAGQATAGRVQIAAMVSRGTRDALALAAQTEGVTVGELIDRAVDAWSRVSRPKAGGT